MNVVTVKINGVEYNLKGDESEEYLHKVATYVDRRIKNILNNNGKLSTSSAAVLTAVNAVDDLFKCDKDYQQLSARLEQLQNQEKILNEQMELMKKQIFQVENYNKELLEKLSRGGQEELIKVKDDSISQLKKELAIIQESAQKYISDNNTVKAENKELKFQLQSAKYKIIDLQNKLIENQINLAKVKKNNMPLLNSEG